MKAMVIRGMGQTFELEDRDVPQPGLDEVLVKVHACGVCHSDHVVTEGLWPGLEFPRVTGPEVAGVVKTVGDRVNQFAVGARV